MKNERESERLLKDFRIAVREAAEIDDDGYLLVNDYVSEIFMQFGTESGAQKVGGYSRMRT